MLDSTTSYQSVGLRLTVSADDDAVVVAAHGELDLATVDLLVTRLEAAAAADVDRLVVDAAGVSFVDGAGLRGLIDPLAETVVQVRTPSMSVLRLLAILDRLDVLEPPGPSTDVRTGGLLDRIDVIAPRPSLTTAEQP